MKKFLIAFIALISVCCASAQTIQFRTTAFAIKHHTSQGWGKWSDWQDSSMLVEIDLSNDFVAIYSPVTQYLKVISEGSDYTDSSGGSNVKFRCYDLVDDCYCYLRLRQERNGNSQIYLEYANIMYVYNVRRL